MDTRDIEKGKNRLMLIFVVCMLLLYHYDHAQLAALFAVGFSIFYCKRYSPKETK